LREFREGRGEIERALKGKLPKLVPDENLRGVLHYHTDASDGMETLDAMNKATRGRGFQYLAAVTRPGLDDCEFVYIQTSGQVLRADAA